jgi:hypothetical protein
MTAFVTQFTVLLELKSKNENYIQLKNIGDSTR